MVRLHARRTRRALDHVQPGHLLRVRVATLGKIAGIARHAGISGIEKISVQRDDNVCSVELVLRLDRLAESHLRASIYIVAVYWLIEMPFGLGKALEHLLHLVGESRRRK